MRLTATPWRRRLATVLQLGLAASSGFLIWVAAQVVALWWPYRGEGNAGLIWLVALLTALGIFPLLRAVIILDEWVKMTHRTRRPRLLCD